MAQKHTGMRKGISLVEMIIAIVLFAALAAIGLKYAKTYLNTDLQAKKARVAAATDQANQLLQAYVVYKTETGNAPTALSDLNGSSMILTAIPTIIGEMSSVGWQYAADHNGTGLPAFFMDLDLNGSFASNTDIKSAKEYCALFNREFNSSTPLNIEYNATFGTQGDLNASKASLGNFVCWSKDANTTQITVFVP